MDGCMMTGKVVCAVSPSKSGVLTDCSSGQLLSSEESLSLLPRLEGVLLRLEGVVFLLSREGEVFNGGDVV